MGENRTDGPLLNGTNSGGVPKSPAELAFEVFVVEGTCTETLLKGVMSAAFELPVPLLEDTFPKAGSVFNGTHSLEVCIPEC